MPIAGALGDGITAWLSKAFLWDNVIFDSHRAGVSLFGSTAELLDNIISCAVFDVAVNPFAQPGGDVESELTGLDANSCGCTDYPRPCVPESGGPPEPPEMIGGLE